MNKNIIKTVVSILTLVFLFAQTETRKPVKFSPMDDELHIAWTVEHLPYKLLTQDAISKYKNLDIQDKLNIPTYNVRDELIIVTSMTNKNEIYQMRYGNSDRGYIILIAEEVQWIFGETLRKTLLNKESYLYINWMSEDRKPNQLELGYIKSTNYWSRNDITVDIPSRIAAKMFNGHYAFNLHWGDEYLGLPYGSLGSFKIGISSKFFEFGVLTPSLLHFSNGTITRKDTTETMDKMSSGMGGYGRFQLQSINGYLSFSSIPFTVEGIDTTDIYHMDFAGLVSYAVDVPFFRNIVPYYKGTTLFNIGFYSYHVSNGRISSEALVINNSHAITINTTYSYLKDQEKSDYYSGIYLRVDGVSKIPEGRSYPRFKWAYQIHTGFSSLFNFTFNFGDKVGLSTTYTKSLNEEIKWDPENAVYFGIIYNFSATD